MMGFAFVSLVGIVGLGVVLTSRASAVSGQAASSPEPYFPTVAGANLSRAKFALPADIEADYAIVTIAFQQRHQLDVNTWIPAMRQLVEAYDNLIFYELPTIRKMPRISQGWIDGGMRAGIPDPYTRATTITLYIDKEPFRDALQIADENQIATFIIDQAGTVYWRADGPATPESLVSLQEALDRLLNST